MARALTPTAHLGCPCVACEPLHTHLPGTQMTIRSLSEAPLASLRQSQRLPHHQPHPQPQPHPHTRPRMLVGVRTGTHPQRHTDTNTHKHTPPPRWVKSQKPQVSDGERERERHQEYHTGFPSPDLHTPPILGIHPAPCRPDHTHAH